MMTCLVMVLCMTLNMNHWASSPNPLPSSGVLFRPTAPPPPWWVLRNVRQRREVTVTFPPPLGRLGCAARSPHRLWGTSLPQGNENAKAFSWKRTTSFLIKSLQICTKRLQGTKFLLQKSKRTSKVRTQNGTSPSLLPLRLSRRPHRGSKHPTAVPTTHTGSGRS